MTEGRESRLQNDMRRPGPYHHKRWLSGTSSEAMEARGIVLWRIGHGSRRSD